MAGGALAAPSELPARLPLVGFGAGAVEVLLHAVTRGPVLAGVRLAGVRRAGNLRTHRRNRLEHQGALEPRLTGEARGPPLAPDGVRSAG